MREQISDRGRLDDLEPIAVIDIGSNSVRLVVYEGAVRAPTPLFNEKALCGLGREVATTGHLGATGIASALSALGRFRAICSNLGVTHLEVVATAAVREATDGAKFISAGSAVLGVPIKVLSGEREAELAAHGIQMGFANPDGVAGDLGGGSLELIDIAGGRLDNARTLPLGGLRLIDVTKNSVEQAANVADAEIAKVEWLQSGRGRTFYAVGGTWRSLARLHMERTDYPLRVTHGYIVPAAEMLAFCEHVRRARKINSLKGISVVSRARRDALPFGAVAMERLLKALQPSQVEFSTFGVREGLLYDLLSEAERARDPLMAFAEDYARLRSRSLRHAKELMVWTDALFPSKTSDETASERRLRHAACLLSDIGWRAHPDYRGEQSLNVIANAALAGVDHTERLFLALTTYFRHAGPAQSPDFMPNTLKGLVSKRAMKRARIVAASIRAAHMLAVGMPDVIDKTPLSVDGSTLVLTIPRTLCDLDGDRLRRRFQTLAELVEKTLVVTISG